MKHSESNTKHKKEGFAVPEGYFDKMKNEILQKAYPKQKRIVLLTNTMMKYAAVLMIGILVAGGWLYMQNQSVNEEELYGLAVENQLYTYEYAMLDEYSTFGSESELITDEDELFLNSEYGDEMLLYEGE